MAHSIPTLFASCILFYAAMAARADVITLRPAVRLDAAASAIRLGDVADLDGPLADAFADVVVAAFDSALGTRELSVRDVRDKLDEAGIHWGKITLNGRSVVIRPARDASASPPMAMAAVAIDGPHERAVPGRSKETVCAASLVSQSALRGVIANVIVSALRISPDRLQLAFSSADAEWLDMSTTAARFEVQPLSSFASDRIEMSVRMWENGQIRHTRSISVAPTIRAAATVAAKDLKKDQVIVEQDVVEAEQWLSPSQARQNIDRIRAIGSIVNSNLRTGELLREKHVRRQTLIKRGDLVTIRCLVGGAVITLQAEAREDGGEGETIGFRKAGERETFRAVVTGRGEAVMDLSRKQALHANQEHIQENG